jgi:hypothetical protein
MYQPALTDLDELVHKVRSRISKIYIIEAVNAYRSGSNRAALISTWIAVSYDIIEKIKELAEGGDAAAASFVTDLNNSIANKNIPKLQGIEESLLDSAFNTYSFISEHEFTSLKRLKEDRNLCAHPAFTDDEVLYQPTPELVRTYIVHAIQFLLIHQPVQGKAAIARIALDLKRESFPIELDKAYDFLFEKYLKRAKDVLIVNLTKALAKVLITKEADYVGKERKIINSLIVISRTHPIIYKNEISSYLSKIVDSLEDEELLTILDLLTANSEGWQWLDPSAKIRMKNILLKKLSDTPETLEKYKLLEELRIEDFDEVKSKVLNEIDDILYKKIYEYSLVRTYQSAARVGNEEIVPIAKFFKPQHLEKIVDVFKTNPHHQIRDAAGSVDVWIEIFDRTLPIIDQTINYWVDLLTVVTDKTDVVRYQRLIERIKEHNFMVNK